MMSTEQEVDLGWVLDSLIGFISGPIWNLPIFQFIEQESVFFDINDNICDEDEYKRIFEEYKTLVDQLLSSHMEDLDITPEAFEEACSKAEGSLSIRFNSTIFEQIWSANDYSIFNRMMKQKNIDLQLQALDLLAQRFGLVPNFFIPEGRCRDVVMEQLITHSKEDIKFGQTEVEEIGIEGREVIAQLAVKERSRLEDERRKTEDAQEEALAAILSSKLEENEINSEIKLKEKSSPVIPKPPSTPTHSDGDDVRARQKYLREQRDKLIELKKRERKKQMERLEGMEEVTTRPKSARTARRAIASILVDEDKFVEDKSKINGLALRKLLAARLKAEVIDRK